VTIKGPDVSNFQSGLRLTAGTPYAAAKSSEGTTFKDGSYQNFKSQAANIGAVFSAYHFLHSGNVKAQAQFAYGIVGKTPLFVDVEATGTSKPMLADVTGFIDAYRALGGVVWAAYIPKWYWSGTMGSPSLKPLSDRHVSLISSAYTAYSDTGPGWTSYGGIVPQLWQYTDRQAYGGMSVDFNAYRGTKQQLAVLVNGGSAPAPAAPAGGGTVLLEEDSDMQIETTSIHPGEYAIPVVSKGHVRFVADLYGNKADLRVVIWDGPNADVHDHVKVGGGYTDIPLTPSTSAVTVRRYPKPAGTNNIDDSGPVGVALY
jgi:GH25 family lysozyme M1 (1,4-beta-N-acetylmuramidase)